MRGEQAEFIRQARILVVDDDEACRNLLAAFLAPIGCAVTQAADGREALERLEDGSWDVVLLDLIMPGLSGFEVLARIRETRPQEVLPVILITGQDDADTRMEALALRANDFLAKPIHHAEVMARMGTILAMHWAREELEERLTELRNAQDLKDLLINCVIHDLKGPLTSAKGNIELALDRLPDGPAARQLRRAADAIDRTVGMAADAVAVARMEEEKLRPAATPFDAAALVRQRVDVLQGMAATREVALVGPEPGAEAPAARGDEGLMARVLDNLIVNALKHTPAGGRVTVGAERGPEGTVTFAVVDTGEGIPAAWLHRIFDKFSQVEMRRKGLGTDTGLGLTFCKLAVEAQGGRIEVDSEPGTGSTFRVSLPGAVASEPAALESVVRWQTAAGVAAVA